MIAGAENDTSFLDAVEDDQLETVVLLISNGAELDKGHGHTEEHLSLLQLIACSTIRNTWSNKERPWTSC